MIKKKKDEQVTITYMVNLEWDGDDLRNSQDSSGATADLVSHSGKLQQGYKHGSLTDGLVAYYPMESGSGETLNDKTQLSNNGNLNPGSSGNTTTSEMWNSNPKIGDYCIGFDGEDDVVRTFSTGISSIKELTVAFWTKVQNNSGDFRAFCSATEDPYNDYETGFTIDQGSNSTSDFSTLNFEFAGDGGGSTNLKTSTQSFGTWVHICIKLSVSKAQLFVNGTAEGSRSNDGTPLKLNDIRIGARAYDNNNSNTNNIERGYVDALIDDLRIYDRLLSTPEINSLYQLTVPSTVSPGETLQ